MSEAVFSTGLNGNDHVYLPSFFQSPDCSLNPDFASSASLRLQGLRPISTLAISFAAFSFGFEDEDD